jgi:starch-binding outer membrane protein, SusD/RagB family
MKKFILSIIAGVMLFSCNDDFLEKLPLESQTEATAFKTYSNFKTYTWQLYSIFTDANILRNVGSTSENGYYEGDVLAGYLQKKGVNARNIYAFQTAIVPASGGGWNFAYVRRVNLMLDNIDKSDLTQAEKDHWRSVGYFFRAYYYAELIARFGDVPWIDKVVTEADEDIIYGTRMPRTDVAQKVMDDLKFAETKIKTTGDGANTINVHAVRALISRFGLFEGTWRKYHAIGGEAAFLTESIRASELLLTAFPNVHSKYDEMFTSPDLSKVPGVILYKEFEENIITANHGHFERTSSAANEMNKATVEMFLCSDGKTISRSPLYDGDKTLYDEMRNRDYRLLLNVAPPYRVNANGTPTANPADAEYVKLMETVSNAGHKRLPLANWSGTTLMAIPNIEPGAPQVFLACRSGYYMYKHFNTWDKNSNLQSLNTADKPIFKIEEVMLNYAEAKFEVGQFDQAVADKTINKLRARVKVANMQVSEIDNNFDPNRDQTVNPVLWEIRRERIVELIGEGFGFYDIRRWKKAPWFLNRQQHGMWVKKSAVSGQVRILDPVTKLPATNLTEGYIYLFNDPVQDGKGWQDRFYLYPIPSDDLALNPKLVQNPGWIN